MPRKRISYSDDTVTRPIESLQVGDSIKVGGEKATVTRVSVSKDWTTVRYTFGEVFIDQDPNGTPVALWP